MPTCRVASALLVSFVCAAPSLDAATLTVAAGGNLQAALNAAAPGDVILLAEGAEFLGNFVLPVKAGQGFITVRSSAADVLLPPDGVRVGPQHAPLLARLRSPNTSPALRTAAGAHHWRLQYLEFAGNQNGYGDILVLGDGSSAQNTLASVPHDLLLDHLYVHGDPWRGQKRCIALNAAGVTIRDSYVADCKTVGQDTQAIGGWNGPGPYTIENNYLEAAGEVVMFGGADPSIAGLVPDGIVIRRNYLSRPMSWRDPILATPAVTASPEGGGTLSAGTYSYRVIARGPVGQGNIGRSTASAQVSATVGNGGAVRLVWAAVPGASEYRVYGRTSGAQSTYWTVTSTAFVDTGGGGSAEAVPTSTGTVWTVKNIFELKNARNVVVENNIFENHWKQAQPGYSIVFTPRNSNGACTWCVVEHVRFAWNIVRHVAAGANLLGYDGGSPSLQMHDIVFVNNLFYDVSTAYGGNGWFMQIGDEPRDITINHNTVDANGSSVVYVYGGTSTDPREVYGFRMTNNAMRHRTYGMAGAYFAYGNAVLTAYYPDAVFTANYLAGGSASRYPAGNLFGGMFEDQFVDVAGVDYTVHESSALYLAGTDGASIGVDMGELRARTAGVESGTSGAPVVAPPTAAFSFACTDLSCAFTDLTTDPNGTLRSWAWAFGDGATDARQSPSHLFPATGTYNTTLTVTDTYGQSTSAAHAVTVTAGNLPPTAGFSASCTGLTCTFTDTSVDADGSLTGWVWNFGDGASSSMRSPSHTFSAAGSYTVTLTATDDDGASDSITHVVDAEASVPCTYAITPTSQSVPSGGGTGSVAVTAPTGCEWTATSNVAWVTVTAGASGSGNGTVAFSVEANSSSSARTGTVTVAGQAFTVSQAGTSSCDATISPTSASIASIGGSGSVSVTAAADCRWQAVSNDSWITIFSGPNGSGTATVRYSVKANTGSVARTGTMTIAGRTFTVNQAATTCNYTLTPTSKAFTAAGGSSFISVSTTSKCAWTAVSSASWVTLTARTSGTGSGSVAYTVAPSTLTTERSATIQIGTATFTITQSGLAAPAPDEAPVTAADNDPDGESR